VVYAKLENKQKDNRGRLLGDLGKRGKPREKVGGKSMNTRRR